MTERVAEQVRRLLHEQPELEVVFTDALTADSYLHSGRSGRPVLFLHTAHRQLVDELAAAVMTPADRTSPMGGRRCAARRRLRDAVGVRTG